MPRPSDFILCLAFAALLSGCSSNVRQVGENPREFDSAVWKTADLGQPTRCDMVHDLIDRVGLVGRTQSELVELLGEPADDGGYDHYHLCPSFMDVWILELRWRDGRVVSTKIRDT